ncbi:MAG TPA: protease pro-enzyme activation domain-containing protein, partial [Acidimicrobiales bacterium]
MPRRTRGRHLLAAGVVVASALAAVGTGTAGTAKAASTLRVLSASVPRELAPGSRVVGALASTTRISFEVTLHVRHAGQLAELLVALNDPRSPSFHRFLTPAQFTARFGATSSELAKVERWLRREGLTPTSVSANRLSIRAVAKSGAIAAALHTSFLAIRGASGAIGFTNRAAPSIPSSITGLVAGVVGLDDLTSLHTDLTRGSRAPLSHAASRAVAHTRGPVACPEASSAASFLNSFTAGGLASYYAMAPLYTLGDLGQGVHVAIMEFEPNSPADITAYQQCYKTSATVSYKMVDGGVGTGTGQGEAALDIENVIGIAPHAVIDVYQAPNSDMGALDMYNKIVADGDKVVTTSWGSCESQTTPSVIAAEETTFAQAGAQGQVVFSAAGDSGSTDCGDSSLAVDDPGSQPGVLSVGGTSASSKGEVVWNDGSGGGGGGISTAHCMPGYQDNTSVPDLVNANTTTDPTLCPAAPQYLRQVPDVTAMADPNTGYTIFWNGSWTSIGGTSGAAPLWAAASALVLASPYCSSFGSTIGVSPSSLYALAATPSYSSALFDVTKGNNNVSSFGNGSGLYPAHSGFDEASGLGSPALTHPAPHGQADLFRPGLASLLCYASRTVTLVPHVTSVSPRHLASNLPTQVTILGTGFLPIAGADRVIVDGVLAMGTCSPVRCTATVPGHPVSGRADLRVQLQIYATSPTSGADVVTFLAAPKVTRLTPGTGPTSGGTRVTIHGSGFAAGAVVRFGARAGTHVSVLSPTVLLATAPAGSGTVYVTVTSTGGKSVPTAA